VSHDIAAELHPANIASCHRRRLGYCHQMTTTDLRPCPFCDGRQLVVARITDDDRVAIAVVCPECGASGPRADGDDPPGHAGFIWNARYGADY
jgi:hypothetical protein